MRRRGLTEGKAIWNPVNKFRSKPSGRRFQNSLPIHNDHGSSLSAQRRVNRAAPPPPSFEITGEACARDPNSQGPPGQPGGKGGDQRRVEGLLRDDDVVGVPISEQVGQKAEREEQHLQAPQSEVFRPTRPAQPANGRAPFELLRGMVPLKSSCPHFDLMSACGPRRRQPRRLRFCTPNQGTELEGDRDDPKRRCRH